MKAAHRPNDCRFSISSLEIRTFRVEARNLVDAGTRVLGQGVDVHLAMRQQQPHADRRVAQAVDRV